MCAQSDYYVQAEFIGHGIGTYYAGDQHYQQLDSIVVVNHSKNWERTIVYPDTILIARYHGTGGIEQASAVSDALSQNVPNPFDGKTEVELYVAENNKVLLQVYDMVGKLYAQYEEWLSAGMYRFSISLSMAQAYLLSANVGNKSYSIKMVNLGKGGGNAISNLGSVVPKLTIDNENAQDETLSISDSMSYVGYTTYDGNVYESRQLSKLWCAGVDTLFFDIPYCNDKTTLLRIQDCVPYSYNGHTYEESGHYVLEELQSVCGADSVVELDFRIGGQIETEFYIETNDGEYQWGDTLLRDSGIYRRQFTSVHGCDSVVTLYLTLFAGYRTYTVRFKGIGISSLDDIERHYQRLDSISIINTERNHRWTLHYPDTTLSAVYYYLTNKLTIENYGHGDPLLVLDRLNIVGYTTYRGVVYENIPLNESGWPFVDSILYFYIPYCEDQTIVYNIQDCEPYTYNGQTYTESGLYLLEELETIHGCDSIIKLDLDISDNIYNEIMIYTCDDSYQIDDTLVTESGVYLRHYTTAHGCDSTMAYIVSLGNGFTDERDGNTYCTVQIGDQIWMAENMRYMPAVNSISEASASWSYISLDRYYFVYGYDGTDVEEAKSTDNYMKYGVLYTRPNIGVHHGDSLVVDVVCPAGWHLPSDEEWSKMEVYLENNGYNFDGYIDVDEDRDTHNVIGKSLAYTSGWTISNEANTVGWLQMKNNSSHFSAMPGGWANIREGVFSGERDFGCWWTSDYDFLSEDPETFLSTFVWNRMLKYNSVSSIRTSIHDSKVALSVRCVRD